MSTRNEPEFDYQAFTRDNPIPPESRRGGIEERERRRQVAKERITIRIDQDVLERFRELAEDGGYQGLINQALRDWLIAGDVKELVRNELEREVSRLRAAWAPEARSSQEPAPEKPAVKRARKAG